MTTPRPSPPSTHAAPSGATARPVAGWTIAGVLCLLLGALGLSYANAQRVAFQATRSAAAQLSIDVLQAPGLLSSDPATAIRSVQASQAALAASGLALPAPTAQAIDALVQQAQPLLAQASDLSALSAARTQMARALAELTSDAAAVRARPGLVSGQWGQALASLMIEYTRPELGAMDSVFSPLPETASLQKQWSDRFVSIDAQAATLTVIAQRDTGLSSADRSALEALLAAGHALAQASTTLVAKHGVWVSSAHASSTLGPLMAPAAAALVAATPQQPSAAIAWWAGGSWILLLGSAVSLLALARANALARRVIHEVSEDSRVSGIQIDAIDRIMRQIQKIAPGDAPIYTGVRIEEPSTSPCFGIASAFNRLVDALGTQQVRTRQIAVQMGDALNPAFDRTNDITVFQQRTRQRLATARPSAMALARSAAVSAERARQIAQDSHAIQDGVWRAAAMLQERGFRMDALRSNNQDIAKRLKRLGESSQGIALAAARIHGISQQVRVLAINTAIAAASAGDEGRVFTVIATEIQRLSQGGNDAADEIDHIVELLLADAAEVASTMEQGISEVVESGQLSQRAEHAIKEIERLGKPAALDLSKLATEMESQALALTQEVSAWEQAEQQSDALTSSLAQLHESLSSLRTQSREIARNVE